MGSLEYAAKGNRFISNPKCCTENWKSSHFCFKVEVGEEASESNIIFIQINHRVLASHVQCA